MEMTRFEIILMVGHILNFIFATLSITFFSMAAFTKAIENRHQHLTYFYYSFGFLLLTIALYAIYILTKVIGI